MAIGTATAILGSAVIGAGVSAMSSSKASKTAANASRYAADQNAQVNRDIYNQTRSDLSPYNQAGQAGLAALTQRLGVASAPPSAPVASGSPAPAPAGTSGGVDGAAYWQANPDLATVPSLANGHPGDLDGDGQETNADRGMWHFQQYGQAEGRQMPSVQAQPQPAAQTQPLVADKAPEPVPGQDLMTARRPEARPAPVMQRPEAPPVPTYERAPAMAAPDLQSYLDPSKFQADPGYQFRVNEAIRGLNAGYGARGLLKSDAAVKGILTRAGNEADQTFQTWRNNQMDAYKAATGAYQFGQNRADNIFGQDRSYGTNLAIDSRDFNNRNADVDYGYATDRYRYDTNRTDNLFDTDRGYQAQRYDQGTSNLFSLAGIGQNAAAGTASAGNVFAQNATANNNQRATTTANAAIAGAQNVSNTVGQIAQGVGMYYGRTF